MRLVKTINQKSFFQDSLSIQSSILVSSGANFLAAEVFPGTSFVVLCYAHWAGNSEGICNLELQTGWFTCLSYFIMVMIMNIQKSTSILLFLFMMTVLLLWMINLLLICLCFFDGSCFVFFIRSALADHRERLAGHEQCHCGHGRYQVGSFLDLHDIIQTISDWFPLILEGKQKLEVHLQKERFVARFWSLGISGRQVSDSDSSESGSAPPVFRATRSWRKQPLHGPQVAVPGMGDLKARDFCWSGANR